MTREVAQLFACLEKSVEMLSKTLRTSKCSECNHRKIFPSKILKCSALICEQIKPIVEYFTTVRPPLMLPEWKNLIGHDYHVVLFAVHQSKVDKYIKTKLWLA